MPASLSQMGEEPHFLDSDCPMAVLGTALIVRAVNPAFETAFYCTSDDAVGSDPFDIFPANPQHDPHGEGHERVRHAIGRALATGLPQHLAFLRHDVPDPRQPGHFIEKYWVPMFCPIFEGNEVVGILACTQDVTAVDEHVRNGFAAQRDLLTGNHQPAAPNGLRTRPASDPAAIDVVPVDDEHRRLAAEAEQLRRALESRATIDQAKGIIMAEHGGGPHEAFQLLIRLSQTTNLKLRDVAAALVSKGTSRPSDVAG